jgi:hypothetical protein
MAAKPTSIKGTECKSSGCALKEVELTSGDLPPVLDAKLRSERSLLSRGQESAEGVVAAKAAKARTVPRKGIEGEMSTRRDSTTDKRQENQYRLAFPEESRECSPDGLRGRDRIGVGEAQSKKSDYRAVDGRSLRAGKLQAGATTSEGQQRESRHRQDERQLFQVSRQLLAYR